MFCDEVKVQFTAGRGGNGAIAFRREKFVPKGGPNGGNGGVGGSIYLEASDHINTLAEFNTQKIFRAKAGENGMGSDCAGKDAQDLVLPVPVGTIIFDEKKKHLLGDLKSHGDRFLIAKGGRGGYGNAHFKSSTRQAPRFAELGEPGQDKTCVLELKLVADIGIIGLPSVGKSTLLGRISNARPKTADYHFTTLIPNLGLVTMKPFGGTTQQSFVACDLPGLIEGAHLGKGLGIKFLKHVARNRVLIHLIDINSLDPEADYRTIMEELKKFDPKLARKSQLLAFNKTENLDGATVKEVTRAFQKNHQKVKKIYSISCITGKGLKELLFAAWNMLQKAKEKDTASLAKPKQAASFKVFRPLEEENPKRFTVKVLKKRKKETSVFAVSGTRLNQIAVMTDINNPEAQARLYDVLEKMHIVPELRRNGAKFGDEIKIGGHTLLYRW